MSVINLSEVVKKLSSHQERSASLIKLLSTTIDKLIVDCQFLDTYLPQFFDIDLILNCRNIKEIIYYVYHKHQLEYVSTTLQNKVTIRLNSTLKFKHEKLESYFCQLFSNRYLKYLTVNIDRIDCTNKIKEVLQHNFNILAVYINSGINSGIVYDKFMNNIFQRNKTILKMKIERLVNKKCLTLLAIRKFKPDEMKNTWGYNIPKDLIVLIAKKLKELELKIKDFLPDIDYEDIIFVVDENKN